MVKRRYDGGNPTTRAKRSRYSSTRGSKVRVVRKRRSRTTRRFKRRGGGLGYGRLLKRNHMGGTNLKNQCKHIHIWGTKASTPLERKMFITLGRNHFIRRYIDAGSSNVSGANNMAIKLCGPYANTMMAAGSYVMSSYGLNGYNSDYPINMEKFLYAWTKMKLLFKQVNENCTIRICLARKKQFGQNYSNGVVTDAWNSNVDQTPSNMYNIMYMKKIKFDQALIAGNGVSTTLREEREVNLYFPFHRIIQAPTWNAVTAEASWTLGAGENDFTYLFIDTNDATFIDQENVKYDFYIEHCFYSLW